MNPENMTEAEFAALAAKVEAEKVRREIERRKKERADRIERNRTLIPALLMVIAHDGRCTDDKPDDLGCSRCWMLGEVERAPYGTASGELECDAQIDVVVTIRTDV